MKLYYYRGKTPNFGDELNPWFWDQLLPGTITGHGESVLVGIGTLLNDGMPQAKRIAIFGTGVGYGTAVPVVEPHWTVYCVRGPLSARALALPDTAAVTDGAALLKTIYTPRVKKRWGIAFMPHAIHAHRGTMELCQRLSIGFISARMPVRQVLDEIAATELLITGAMHGAIVADALRVPWICAKMPGDAAAASEFKWNDWCQSLGLTCRCHHLSPVWAAPERLTWPGRVRREAKLRHVTRQLRRIANTVRPMLSDERRLEERVQELQQRLRLFRADLQAGHYVV